VKGIDVNAALGTAEGMSTFEALRPGELLQGKTSSGQGLDFFKPLWTPEN
jgi:hypothetical protein